MNVSTLKNRFYETIVDIVVSFLTLSAFVFFKGQIRVIVLRVESMLIDVKTLLNLFLQALGKPPRTLLPYALLTPSPPPVASTTSKSKSTAKAEMGKDRWLIIVISKRAFLKSKSKHRHKH